MATRFWMITNRNQKKDGLGADRAELSYWTSESGGLDTFSNWTAVRRNEFKKSVLAAAEAFPVVTDPHEHEKQKHVTLFIHGFNNDWADAARRYESICGKLFAPDDGLGICILFNWPSDGSKLGYFPDRIDAAKSAPDLSEVLNRFYDWMLDKQRKAMEDPNDTCNAKISVIAHSMGNYLLQKAMKFTWTRNNQPLLVSLVNQLLMVAADVDNDLFKSGETTDKSDGDAIANLTYRVTALYTGRDSVLGLSAGFKHFGKRRLGRTGLDRNYPLSDNVWDFDCSKLFPENQDNIHSAYFEAPRTIELMETILRGTDRKIIANEFGG